MADRVVFDKLVHVLVFGCGYRRIEDATCSATTLRDRRDGWIALGIFDELELLVLHAYDRMIGLELGDLAVGSPSCAASSAEHGPGTVGTTGPTVAHGHAYPRSL